MQHSRLGFVGYIIVSASIMLALILPTRTIAAQDAADASPPPPAPLKVFILAGQSNMEGKGWASHIENQKDDPALAADFPKLMKDGKWIVRDDVWIAYPTNAMRGGPKHGKLTVGFGTHRHDDVGDEIGPEFGFGHAVGEAFDEQVLLIKVAWGGKNLKADFLPPSEQGGPGPFYTQMVNHVRDVLDNLEHKFPEYDGQGYEMAGFVWFQGFNDMVDHQQRQEQYVNYTRRLVSLIRDVRAEFDVPDMPVVVGQCGTGGPAERGAFQKAQRDATQRPEFADTVAFVPTAEYVDTHALELYKADVWKDPENKHKFYDIASDRPYHYLGSGKTYYLIGKALGESMIELCEVDKSQ